MPIRAAPSAVEHAKREIEKSNPVTKQDVLKLIPQYEIGHIFLRRHLNREFVLGTIGEKGGGKSTSDAVIATTDCMFIGKTVFSNIEIKVDIIIDDDTALKYGLNSGGIANFKSQPLEKDALLKLDERYLGAALDIEEINVEYSNARRAMSNTNVDFNEVVQQLRKWKCPLIYNVIDEMFIDVQLRTLTDIFIKTYDTAFDIENLQRKKPTGLDFHWEVYPMTGYLAGEQGKHDITHRTIGPIYLHFKPWRGIINTNQHQTKGIYSISTRDKNKMIMADISAESSEEMKGALNEWSWLIEAARGWRDAGIKEYSSGDIAERLGRPMTRDIRAFLPSIGIKWNRFVQKWQVNDFRLTHITG